MRQLFMACGFAAQMIVMVPATAQTLDFADPLGFVFTGTVTVQALTTDGTDVLHRARGEGVTTLSPTQDSVLSVKGSASMGGQNALRFDHVLHEQADGSWLHESDDMRMEITPSGAITMSVRSGEDNFEGQGSISKEAFRLQLRIAANAPQPELIFDFDLIRGSNSIASKPDQDCAQTVWQQRFIANPFGSTMSTVMVPVCIPAR